MPSSGWRAGSTWLFTVASGRWWLSSLPSRLPSEMTADLPLLGRGVRLARPLALAHLPGPEQVRCPAGGRVRGRSPDRAGPGGPAPPVGPHDPLDGAPGGGDTLPLQVSPHLQAAIQRLRRPPAVLAGLVDPGQDLGVSGVPQCPPGRPGGQLRPVGPGGDLDTVRGQRTADGATPDRSLWASMNAQISGVAGRTPARRNSSPPSGSRWSAPVRRSCA